MKLKLHHLIYAAIAVAALVLLFGRGGAEGAIRRHLDDLAETIAKDGDEGGLALAERARRLGQAFTDGFVIALEPFAVEIRDRATLGRQFAAYRHGTQSIEARFTAVEIALGDSQRSATVLADAMLTARWQDARPPGRERYRLRFDYLLDRGDWRIERLTLVEVIEGPARLF